MKKWIHAATKLTNSVDLVSRLVAELKQQAEGSVVANPRYNEIRVEDIKDEQTLINDVIYALHNLNYYTFIPESEDYVAVITGEKFIKLYVSSYLEADNQLNGYIDFDFTEQNIIFEDWYDDYCSKQGDLL